MSPRAQQNSVGTSTTAWYKTTDLLTYWIGSIMAQI